MMSKDTNYIRNLPVPYFSQRENTYVWHEREPLFKGVDENNIPISNPKGGHLVEKGDTLPLADSSCNITCLAMLLHYAGITTDSPNDMLLKIFGPENEDNSLKYLYADTDSQKRVREKTWGCLDAKKKLDTNKNIGHPDIMKEIVNAFYSGEVATSYSINDISFLQKQIALGYPIMISCGITKEAPAVSGHFIVIRGFTSDDGVIINDPWGKPTVDTKTWKASYETSPYGDNIKLSKTEFSNQYGSKFYSTLVIHHQRWGYVFNNGFFPHNLRSSDTNFEAVFEKLYTQETFEYGGFPMKRSNLWHNGIHLKAEDGNSVYPIGPGRIVAARIVNENSSDTNDKAPVNGDRCFVLIKHQIAIGDKIEEFFSLYMHLTPVQDLTEICTNYSTTTKSNIEWLDYLIERSKNIFRLRWGDTIAVDIIRDSDSKSIGTLSSGQIMTYTSQKNNNIYYEWEGSPCHSKTDDILTSFTDNKKAYSDVLDSLQNGEITYFNDLPDPFIEVNNKTNLGKIGQFGGYDAKNQTMLHLEIFSDENIIPDKEPFLFYKKENDVSNAFCDREKMINYFDTNKIFEQSCKKTTIFNWNETTKKFTITQTAPIELDFVELKDGYISKSEMKTFYTQNPGIFRYSIFQHKSEWSDTIDWKKEKKNAIGVPKGHPVITYNPSVMLSLNMNEPKIENDIDTYIERIYNPYKWFSKSCITAMESNSKTPFSKGCATFYHPLGFLEWLYKKDDALLSK
jgi:hypothetical protein